MTLNERIIAAIAPLDIPVSVMVHAVDKGKSDRFIVMIPQTDDIEYADDMPMNFTENIGLQLYCKGNYLGFRDEVTNALTAADITITGRRYLEYEEDTEYHHYIIEAAAVCE